MKYELETTETLIELLRDCWKNHNGVYDLTTSDNDRVLDLIQRLDDDMYYWKEQIETPLQNR